MPAPTNMTLVPTMPVGAIIDRPLPRFPPQVQYQADAKLTPHLQGAKPYGFLLTLDTGHRQYAYR